LLAASNQDSIGNNHLGNDRLGRGEAKAIAAGYDPWNRQRWRAELRYGKANRWLEGSEIIPGMLRTVTSRLNRQDRKKIDHAGTLEADSACKGKAQS
jgi:hypothetical protein